MKIIEIVTLPKSAWFPNYQRYRYQVLITQIEYLDEDFQEISHKERYGRVESDWAGSSF